MQVRWPRGCERSAPTQWMRRLASTSSSRAGRSDDPGPRAVKGACHAACHDMRLLVLQRGTYEAADESADHRRAKHAPVVVVVVAVVVAVVVVVMPRLVVLRGRRRGSVPRDFVSVGGSSWLGVPVALCGSLHDMLCGRGRLSRHGGWGLALCRSAALGRGSGSSAESAAKCNCSHQFHQFLVHCRVPFIIVRKPILALTQSKETSAPLSDRTFLVNFFRDDFGIIRV